ncbi:MAG: hypothetical protein V1714_02130 [Pseudomonadota bacterium]
MDEGVDPEQMCQSLVGKITQSRQLKAIADPELLILFEDWLEELEEEVVSLGKNQGTLSPADLSEKLGLSERGAMFLLSKLQRDGKV